MAIEIYIYIYQITRGYVLHTRPGEIGPRHRWTRCKPWTARPSPRHSFGRTSLRPARKRLGAERTRRRGWKYGGSIGEISIYKYIYIYIYILVIYRYNVYIYIMYMYNVYTLYIIYNVYLYIYNVYIYIYIYAYLWWLEFSFIRFYS